MKRVTREYLGMVNDNQALEKQMPGFKELSLERENEIEDIIKVLSLLKELAKAKREYFILKKENSSYYNEAWNIYEGSFPELFLDRMSKLERNKINAYSELFEKVRGNLNSKIFIPGKKAIYLNKVLEELEKATNMDFKGIIYTEECKKLNMSFTAYRETKHYDEIRKHYDDRWADGMKQINNIINMLDSYQTEVILNKGRYYKIERSSGVKVGIA